VAYADPATSAIARDARCLAAAPWLCGAYGEASFLRMAYTRAAAGGRRHRLVFWNWACVAKRQFGSQAVNSVLRGLQFDDLGPRPLDRHLTLSAAISVPAVSVTPYFNCPASTAQPTVADDAVAERLTVQKQVARVGGSDVHLE